jgi:O-antigen ligase
MRFSPSRAALVLLAALLVGYAFVGRPFAYVGIAPVHVGEIVLALSLLAALLTGALRLPLRYPVAWLLLAFMAFGAVRTLPYISSYGFDALRDAALWGYGLLALIVSGLLQRSGSFSRVPSFYGRFAFWFVLWAPLAIVVSSLIRDSLPFMPGSPEVPVFGLRSTDPPVHLAGAAAFVLLGLGPVISARGPLARPLLKSLWWFSWFAAVLMGASISRASLLAVAMSLCLVLAVLPFGRALRFTLIAVTMLVALVPTIDLDLGGVRDVSSRQLAENLTTIFMRPGADETAEWRLEWWDTIRDYTIYGPYFWQGKGFGINLADDDGFHLFEDDSLRSPHNGHLTVLARMGIPGLALWALLQAAFVVALFRAFLRARRRGEEWWARLDIFVLAYWLAFVVNGSFDVWLESPHGGIWFWCLFGLGLAALQMQQRAFAASPPRRRVAPPATLNQSPLSDVRT